MSRVPLIIGNWKMHKTDAEARAFVFALSAQIASTERRTFIAAPFIAIAGAAEAAQGTRICVGAQNMHDQEAGAYTGEISASMLKSSGASFVLLGHSERRQYFHETNSFIHRKILRALQEGLIPILCVGESEGGECERVLKTQLEECLQGLSAEQVSHCIIAYEPIWAIGTGKAATPELAQTVHRFIRLWLEEGFGRECAQRICLLYGGSVSPGNIAALMQQTDIDGVLVGGASLDVKSLAQIVNY
jgi:triosephosphate isomerase (TIM)